MGDAEVNRVLCKHRREELSDTEINEVLEGLELCISKSADEGAGGTEHQGGKSACRKVYVASSLGEEVKCKVDHETEIPGRAWLGADLNCQGVAILDVARSGLKASF